MERKKGEKPFGARMGEASFCIIYLIYIFVIAGVLWSKYKMSDTIDYTETYYLYKIRYISGFVMAMFLGCGDAFHLVPRIIVNIKDGIKNQEFYLPVAIKGKENPKLGMLMIPKTICYMWMMGVICWG
ncbi:MAG: hypothetical protein IJ232_00855 [Lachnospiraceae bacterium]|nr:hypothetical protein [Lachnospiraceae bacterium]